jgi:hypothetical protein
MAAVSPHLLVLKQWLCYRYGALSLMRAHPGSAVREPVDNLAPLSPARFGGDYADGAASLHCLPRAASRSTEPIPDRLWYP